MLIILAILLGLVLGQYIKVDVDPNLKSFALNSADYTIEWLLDAYTTVKIAIKPESEAPDVINTEFDAIELQQRKRKLTQNILVDRDRQEELNKVQAKFLNS